MGDRWGTGSPPEDAYSRVTDPEIYRPLHGIAEAVLEDLVRRFDVVREEVAGPGRSVRLTPAAEGAAALTVEFTDFPGLRVHLGRESGSGAPVPMCGCDACDETVEDCRESLLRLMAALTAGTFGERLVRDAEGWWHESWTEADGRSANRTRLFSDEDVEALRRALPGGELTWRPWTPRPA